MRISSLERRLKKLEERLPPSDGSGFVPHTQEWLKFWLEWSLLRLAGEDPEPQKISLEAFRAIAALAEGETVVHR